MVCGLRLQCRGYRFNPLVGDPKIPHAPQLKNQSIFENPRSNIMYLVKVSNTVHVRKKNIRARNFLYVLIHHPHPTFLTF